MKSLRSDSFQALIPFKIVWTSIKGFDSDILDETL